MFGTRQYLFSQCDNKLEWSNQKRAQDIQRALAQDSTAPALAQESVSVCAGIILRADGRWTCNSYKKKSREMANFADTYALLKFIGAHRYEYGPGELWRKLYASSKVSTNDLRISVFTIGLYDILTTMTDRWSDDRKLKFRGIQSLIEQKLTCIETRLANVESTMVQNHDHVCTLIHEMKQSMSASFKQELTNALAQQEVRITDTICNQIRDEFLKINDKIECTLSKIMEMQTNADDLKHLDKCGIDHVVDELRKLKNCPNDVDFCEWDTYAEYEASKVEGKPFDVITEHFRTFATRLSDVSISGNKNARVPVEFNQDGLKLWLTPTAASQYVIQSGITCCALSACANLLQILSCNQHWLVEYKRTLSEDFCLPELMSSYDRIHGLLNGQSLDDHNDVYVKQYIPENKMLKVSHLYCELIQMNKNGGCCIFVVTGTDPKNRYSHCYPAFFGHDGLDYLLKYQFFEYKMKRNTGVLDRNVLRKSTTENIDDFLAIMCSDIRLQHTGSQIKKHFQVFLGDMEESLDWLLEDGLQYVSEIWSVDVLKRIGDADSDELSEKWPSPTCNVDGFRFDKGQKIWHMDTVSGKCTSWAAWVLTRCNETIVLKDKSICTINFYQIQYRGDTGRHYDDYVPECILISRDSEATPVMTHGHGKFVAPNNGNDLKRSIKNMDSLAESNPTKKMKY